MIPAMLTTEKMTENTDLLISNLIHLTDIPSRIKQLEIGGL